MQLQLQYRHGSEGRCRQMTKSPDASFTENILEAPDDETVCWCSGVNKRTILEAIRNGARNMDGMRRMTGACTLGRCKEMSPRGRCCSKEIMKLLEAENS